MNEILIGRREFIKFLGMGCFSLGGYYYSFKYNPNRIELNNVEVPIKNLDAVFDGFKITQISDLHCDNSGALERLEKTVDIINEQNSDIVVITGDYFTDKEAMKNFKNDCFQLLRSIKSKMGLLSVAGNHDYCVNFSGLRKMVETAGIRMLDNEMINITKHGGKFSIVGLSSLWMKKIRPAKAFSGSESPKIVLAHNPDSAISASPYDPDIMLCGHTHGGQVAIPFLGPVINFTQIGKKYASGLNRYNNMFIYTNRGIGTYYLHARLFCPPEITNIVLKRQKNS